MTFAIGTRVVNVLNRERGTVVPPNPWARAIPGRTCVRYDDSDVACWYVPDESLAALDNAELEREVNE